MISEAAGAARTTPMSATNCEAVEPDLTKAPATGDGRRGLLAGVQLLGDSLASRLAVYVPIVASVCQGAGRPVRGRLP